MKAAIAACAMTLAGCRSCAKQPVAIADAAVDSAPPITFAVTRRIVINRLGAGDDVPTGCALMRSGEWRCWLNEFNSITRVARFPELDGAKEVALGWHHACLIRKDGDVLCWGENQGGQIGDGTEDDSPKPKAIGVHHAVRIVSDDFRTCALLEDESVQCWGNQLTGMAMRSGVRQPSTPEIVLSPGKGIVDIAMIRTNWCVVARNGYATCEKDPYFKVPPPRVGDERQIVRFMPASDDTWSFTFCVLEPDSTLWCVPQRDSRLGEWTEIARSVKTLNATSESVAYAIGNDGHVLALGSIITLDRDAGTTIARPRPLAGIDRAVDIATGARYDTCVLRDDDSIWCWTEKDPTPHPIVF